MITRLSCFIVLACLAGCATSDDHPAITALQEPVHRSAISRIIPTDEAERDLIAHPDDLRGLGDRASLLYRRAAAATQEIEVRALRKQARLFALAAVEGGSRSLLLPVILAEIREDGTTTEAVHSHQAQAQALVATGEKKFGVGDFEGALAAYLQAWELDPTSHHAALYIGDVYFNQKDFLHAIEWFDRAIALEPFIENAHRYRGDALMRLKRNDEALESYISAVVAYPYSPLTRGMIERWAGQNRRAFIQLDVSFPRGELKVNGEKYDLTYDPNSGPLSLVYLLARTKYCQTTPKIPGGYRHTLGEEADGLRGMLAAAAEQVKSTELAADQNTHAAILERLRQLNDSELLEAHILLDRADTGIVRDYVAYRSAHADLIRRYVRETWLAPK